MNIVRRIANYAAYRRTVRELKSLDSHMLRDIGINRYEIPTVAARATVN